MIAETDAIGQWPHPSGDPLNGDDEALALYICYELYYRGFSGVGDDWAWEPTLLAFRRELEARLFSAVSDRVGDRILPAPKSSAEVADRLNAIIARPARSLSQFMADHGTLRQFEEVAIHRSVYQLKEADPHTWAIPRLYGKSKAALVAIQRDKYGDGDADRAHSALFAQTLRSLGLRTAYGAYLDSIPAISLSTVNLISMFGLHRRWRGALVGHLAVLEMTSVRANTNYAKALRRLGFDELATEFFDVHVVANEVHQRIARNDFAAQLACDEPGLASDIIFGGEAVTAIERMFAEHLFNAWATGDSALYCRVHAVAQAS